MTRTLGEDEIFERIEVNPPYYALSDVEELGEGWVRAGVPADRSTASEEGCLSAAQAGRHLAILGSIGASLVNPDPGRHFYLAYDAEYRRARRPPPDAEGPLVGTARAQLLDPGTAVALAEVRTPSGEPLASVCVYYLVVREADFRGLFDGHARPDEDHSARPDPYTLTKPMAETSVWDTRLFTTLGEITPYDCQGHFPGLPAMPVAYLLANLSPRVEHLLRVVLDRGDETPQYAIREASIRAENLAFAGEPVDCHVEYQRFASGTHWFHCAAIANGGKPVGKVHLKLRVRD